MKRVPSETMRNVLLLLITSMIGFLASCSSTDVMKVRQFHLSTVDPTDRDAQMVRGEQMYRLRGAVTLEERQERLGQYYTVTWKNNQASMGPMKIIMDYQQAATGSKNLRMSRDLPSDQTSGQVEFKVTGEAYRRGGRILAWRIRMIQGDKIISEKRSYLWR